MRPANPGLTALLNGVIEGTIPAQVRFADCYTFELKDGSVLRYTTAQYDVVAMAPDGTGPYRWYAGRVLLSGLKFKSGVGVEVDEQEVVLSASPLTLVDGIPFMAALQKGYFDAATVQRDRFFFSTNFTGAPTGGITFFRGRMSTVDDIGDLEATCHVKSDMVLLNTPMPRNVCQSGCLNTLYDSQCRADKDTFAFQGTVEAGSTTQIINWASATADLFAQGTVRFETGPNIGAIRTIKQSTGTQLVLTYALEFPPTDTDDFVAFYGCDKTKETCFARFNNLANFRGFPFVPQPEQAF